METSYDLEQRPIGEILKEAGLINEGQIQVALTEQHIYTDLRLGEILVLHGWLEQETADFFGEKIKSLVVKKELKKIGDYFYEAGLLSKKDLESILEEQRKLGVKFGSVAVLKGCIKQETLEFFLKYFASEKPGETDFSYKDKNILMEREFALQTQKRHQDDKTTVNNHANEDNEIKEQEFEIPWVD